MEKKISFLFDVDGTLTPSRLTIDPYFESFFYRKALKNIVVSLKLFNKFNYQINDTIYMKNFHLIKKYVNHH